MYSAPFILFKVVLMGSLWVRFALMYIGSTIASFMLAEARMYIAYIVVTNSKAIYM